MVFQIAGYILFDNFDIDVFDFYGDEEIYSSYGEIILSYTGLTNGLFGSLFGVSILIPYLAVTSRRLHDLNLSGWWQTALYVTVFISEIVSFTYESPTLETVNTLITFAVIVGFIIILSRKGSKGTNRFGTPTHYQDILNTFD